MERSIEAQFVSTLTRFFPKTPFFKLFPNPPKVLKEYMQSEYVIMWLTKIYLPE